MTDQPKPTPSWPRRWGLKWISENRLDGRREYILWNAGQRFLFRTRQEAREARDIKYGYIRNRPDLKAEPHGWRLPQVVKVEVIVREVTHDQTD